MANSQTSRYGMTAAFSVTLWSINKKCKEPNFHLKGPTENNLYLNLSAFFVTFLSLSNTKTQFSY